MDKYSLMHLAVQLVAQNYQPETPLPMSPDERLDAVIEAYRKMYDEIENYSPGTKKD